MYKLITGPIACTTMELAAMLFQVVGAKPVTILARTEPTLIGGKSCPLHGLTKLASVNGIMNFSYEKSVNRMRVRRGAPTTREGNVEHFDAAPRAWGSRLFSKATGKKVPLVAKTVPDAHLTFEELKALQADELFLEMKVQKSLTRQYELNGEIVPEEDVIPHLRKSANPHGVVLRDYRLDHLYEVVMDGNVYMLATQV